MPPAERVAAFTVHNIVSDKVEHQQFARMQDCIDAQYVYHSADYDNLSKCTVIGTIVGLPFKSELIPTGRGWYCAMIGSLHICRRTRNECSEQIQRGTDNGKTVLTCTAQELAYGVTTDESAWLFGSEQACDKSLDFISGGSRCTKIR